MQISSNKRHFAWNFKSPFWEKLENNQLSSVELAMVNLGLCRRVFSFYAIQCKIITDPDQTRCSVTSNLSLHGLSKYYLWNINSADDILKYVSFFFFFRKKGFDNT